MDTTQDTNSSRILRYKRITSSWLDDRTFNNKKKRTCRMVDFAVLADHRVKLKESEEKNKYIDLT